MNSSSVELCISVANYLGYPAYFKVVYKLALNETIPSNSTPSPEQVVMEWRTVLSDREERKLLVNVPVHTLRGETHVVLVFELWIFDITRGVWSYTGRWNHLHINIVVL